MADRSAGRCEPLVSEAGSLRGCCGSGSGHERQARASPGNTGMAQRYQNLLRHAREGLCRDCHGLDSQWLVRRLCRDWQGGLPGDDKF